MFTRLVGCYYVGTEYAVYCFRHHVQTHLWQSALGPSANRENRAPWAHLISEKIRQTLSVQNNVPGLC